MLNQPSPAWVLHDTAAHFTILGSSNALEECELSIFFNIDIYIDTNVNATRKLNATIVARLSPGYMVNIVVSC